MPGASKNALDWLVASGELYEKPVALFSPSPYARFAPASLVETLTVMMARLIPDAFVNISTRWGSEIGELHATANVGLLTRVERALDAFAVRWAYFRRPTASFPPFNII
jgi:chromate reductase